MISVVTPTYNRGNLLKKCFNSLLLQSNSDFEWIIIDDGSTDNTKDIVKSFSRDRKLNFDINYIYKENGGKHTALNTSYEHINGDYVVVLDSDDIFESFAIEKIELAWQKWKNNKEVGMITFLKAEKGNNSPICYVRNSNVPVYSYKEKRICNTGRDCCDTFRKELFIKYKFPSFANEKFIGEGAVWQLLEFEAKTVYINEIIYRSEYLNGGLTKLGRKFFNSNPNGGMYTTNIGMDSRLSMVSRIKNGILYSNYSKFAKVSFSRAYHDSQYKIIMLITYIPGFLVYLYWKSRKLYNYYPNNDKKI